MVLSIPGGARTALCATALLLFGSVAPTLAQQQTQAGLGRNFSGLQLDGDQPISIEAEQLDVDDAAATATFTGNVQVTQGPTELRTSKLVVDYQRPEDEQNGQGGGSGGQGQNQGQGQSGGQTGGLPGGSSSIERLEASGDVYVKSQNQVATARRGSFDMAKQLIVMTGDVVLTQGENVAEGCRLTIQADTGRARLESRNCGANESGGSGRVRLMLSPDQAPSGAGASQ